MSKRRVTLTLDEELLAVFDGARSLSSAVNDALAETVSRKLHQRALLEWIHELNARHGAPSPADYAVADDVLADAGFRSAAPSPEAR
jgi:hypothetical protein